MLQIFKQGLITAFISSLCFMGLIAWNPLDYRAVETIHVVDTVYVLKTDTIELRDTIYIEVDKSTIPERKENLGYPQHVIEYIETHLPYAQMLEDSFGIDKIFALSQPAFESGWGTSKNALNANNLFGIMRCKGYKGYGKWTKFDSFEDGWRKYAFLINKYRKKAKTCDELVYTIAHSTYAGYGSDKKGAEEYAEKVYGVVEMIKSYLNE